MSAVTLDRRSASWLMATLAWSGYTLIAVQGRAGHIVHRARLHVCRRRRALFASLRAHRDVVTAPQRVFNAHALGVYLFARTLPGIFAFRGSPISAPASARCAARSWSISGRLRSALLSLVLLGEGPDAVQIAGGSLILAGIWSSLRK